MTGPKFFAEALAEYEDAVGYDEKRQQGLGSRLILELDEVPSLSRSSSPKRSPPCRRRPWVSGFAG